MIKNDPSEFQPQLEILNGIYRGVIEDNNDPEKRGRCKIRVFGINTENKTKTNFDGIPTEELLWSEPCMGLLEGSVSGFGLWSVPVQGSHVFVFFEAGHILKPKYFATVPGVPTNPSNPSKGFNDPNGNYPTEHRLNEPDFHRLSREVTEETLLDIKKENQIKGITNGLNKGTWDEPDSAYKAKYPDNIVFTTHGGITIEIDNTPNEQRVHLYHPSNTYIEIDKDGNVSIKETGNKFEIIEKSSNKYIMKDENETIDNNKTKYIKQNEYMQVDSNQEEKIGGNRKLTIEGNSTIDVSGKCDNTVSGVHTIKGSTIHLNP